MKWTSGSLFVIALVILVSLTGCFGGGSAPPTYGLINGHVRIVNTPVPAIPRVPTAVSKVRFFVEPSLLKKERPQVVPGEVSVKFKSDASERDINELVKKHGLQVKRVFELSGTHVLSTGGRPVDEVIRKLEAEPLVESASPRVLGRLLAVPNDPCYMYQWHYPAISLAPAWNLTTGNSQVIVAVIDSGVQTDHPDLQANLVPGWDFYYSDNDPTDYCGHGTHVAGIVGAVGNNSIGVTGVNWQVKVMPLKVTDDARDLGQVVVDLDAVEEAIRWAVDQGARVINLSLGAEDITQYPPVDSAIEYAVSNGVTLVAAAGNDSSKPICYPACNPNVIAVGAVRYDLGRASWSSYGPELDVVAPGGGEPGDPTEENILSTWTGGSYAYAAGTSMASPHVAGVIALMLAREEITPGNIRSTLQLTAMDLGPLGRDDENGYGLINAHAAITNSRVTSMQVFAGYESSGYVYRKSDAVVPGTEGFYSITNVESGSWYVYGWIDVNRNGAIDGGDYFGRTGGKVTVSGGTVNNVNFDTSLLELGVATRSIVPWNK
ncbi:MAG: serine protease [Bacillota bacterium]|nr:serine protease [Bacillota bacterium]